MFFIKMFVRNAKKFVKYYFFPNSKLTKDLLYLLKKNKIKEPVIFDVGAYHGNWIGNYLKYFPNAFAYLFEPYEISYNILKKRFKKKKRVNIYKNALSSIEGCVEVNINTKAYTNSLLELDPEATKSWSKNKYEHLYQEKVQTITLQDFANKNNIKRINILKLDVQGYESRVLKGAEMLLKEFLIDILVLEVIVAPTYKEQSKIHEIFEIFEKNNYKLYGIYDIEKNSKREKIQQFDVIFYNPELNL